MNWVNDILAFSARRRERRDDLVANFEGGVESWSSCRVRLVRLAQGDNLADKFVAGYNTKSHAFR